MLFRLKPKCGPHVQGGKQYEPGDVVESEGDLAAVFPGKFEKVGDSVPTPQPPSAVPFPGGENATDVTDEFAAAEGTDFRVFRLGEGKKSRFAVCSGGHGIPLNDEPLLRKEVDPFIEKVMAEANDLSGDKE